MILWGFLIKWWDVPRIQELTDIGPIELIEIILGYKLFGADCFGILPCGGVVFVGMFIAFLFKFS